jgi:ligand-binding SRPBCC domain-containing protein
MAWRPVRTLVRRQRVPRSLDATFAFFARPENLPRITPPWLDLRLVTPGPIRMARGLTLDYTVRVLGMRRRWRSEIVEYDPPHGFRDVQALGPYRRWDHRHRFRGDHGDTLIEDVVVYEPPLGPLGALLDAVVIRRRLAAIFDYREQKLGEILGLPTSAGRNRRGGSRR